MKETILKCDCCKKELETPQNEWMYKFITQTFTKRKLLGIYYYGFKAEKPKEYDLCSKCEREIFNEIEKRVTTP